MVFRKKFDQIVNKRNSLLCIGLDPDLEKIPGHLLRKKDPIFEFNKEIIDATYDLVCAYKPNIAFYEAYGLDGLSQLKKTIEYLKSNYPEIPIVLDAKRGDIGNTSVMYAKAMFEFWDVDATTVNPLGGFESIEPFLKYQGRGIIVWCRSSNPTAPEFQDLRINKNSLYIIIAKKIREWSKTYDNCFMFVGATWPDQLREIRKIVPKMFILVPGIGPQQGNLEKTVINGITKNKSGLMINSSRGIIYASNGNNFAEIAREKAQRLRNEINKYR